MLGKFKLGGWEEVVGNLKYLHSMTKSDEDPVSKITTRIACTGNTFDTLRTGFPPGEKKIARFYWFSC